MSGGDPALARSENNVRQISSNFQRLIDFDCASLVSTFTKYALRSETPRANAPFTQHTHISHTHHFASIHRGVVKQEIGGELFVFAAREKRLRRSFKFKPERREAIDGSLLILGDLDLPFAFAAEPRAF